MTADDFSSAKRPFVWCHDDDDDDDDHDDDDDNSHDDDHHHGHIVDDDHQHDLLQLSRCVFTSPLCTPL